MPDQAVGQSTTDEDQELMAEAQRNPKAFSALYRRHLDRVYRYFRYRVGNEQDAQDLTTQTFMAALESIKSYRGTGTVAAWLLGIAHHKLVDWRRATRDWAPLTTAAEVVDTADSPEIQATWASDRQALEQALLRLSPDRAEAIALRYFGELTNREVAMVMGKEEAAVKMLIHRGLADLRTRCGNLFAMETGETQ
ncbi:MAG: RNA polymerase sigma factor [Caldilineaceae bacterium]